MSQPHVSRRTALKGAAGVTAAVLAGSAGRNAAYAAGSDTIRIALVGCGNRGSKDAINCLQSAEGVELVAAADLFEDRLDAGLKSIRSGNVRYARDARLGKEIPKTVSDGPVAKQMKITPDRRFVGFDACEKVLALPDVDYVLLCEPPGFRPEHFQAAVKAGKHIFFEKPVAVDPAGVRAILAASKAAADKGLTVLPGTQMRHWKMVQDTVQRIHDGAIGTLVGGQCYYNTGGLWRRPVAKDWSEAETQIRNWYYYTWLSGDHIVEQHIHNIDLMNWCFGGPPVKAIGMGGRQVRTDSGYGNIWDHFAVEFEYDGGPRVISMCRQTDGCTRRITEYIIGTKGQACPRVGEISDLKGNVTWKFAGEQMDPSIQEHADAIAGIRAGKPINYGRRVAESTMTAILGRMSAYTGREIKFSWAIKSSKLNLMPKDLKFGPLPVRDVAMPGKTKVM